MPRGTDASKAVSSPSLTQRAVAGIGWGWSAVAATAALQLIYTAAMSRLLEPADFGIMAVTLLALRFIAQFSRVGLASALVQRPELSRLDICTAYRLAFLIGAVCAGAVVAAAPLLARIVDEPRAVGVMRWMAISVLAGAVGAVPEALIRRRYQFRPLAIIQVCSTAVGYLAVGIPLALEGWGVGSLVASQTSQILLMLVLSSFISRPPLRGGFSASSARSLLRFGGAVTLTSFFEFVQASLDTLAVGRFVGASGLGQYTRATMIVGLPVEQLTAATSRVLLPVLSRVQDDARRSAEAVTTLLGLTALVVMLPVAFISGASPVVVPWLLGPGWQEAARVLPIVGAAYGLALLTSALGTAADSRGMVTRKLVVQVLSLATAGLSVGVALLNGPTLIQLAVAWAVGELARHVYYWVWIVPRLDVARRELLLRYSFAALVSLVAAMPSTIAIRLYSSGTVGAVLLAAVAGLVLALGIVASRFGDRLRNDLAKVRQRARYDKDSGSS
jgi:O-antigen/teichoic acid export membrane protein